MFFPEESSSKVEDCSRTVTALIIQVYLYENGKADQKPVPHKLVKRKSSFKDIARAMRVTQIRVYNS